MTYPFDIEKTGVIVCAYPDMQCRCEIWQFFLRHGFKQEQMLFYSKRDFAAAFNTGIQIALRSKAEHFIFIEKDIRPDIRTDAFLECDLADIVGCVYPITSGLWGWVEPTALHTGLWRTRREVLEKLPKPLFRCEYNIDGTQITKCVCLHFRDLALANGFTVRHAGFADHKVRDSGC